MLIHKIHIQLTHRDVFEEAITVINGVEENCLRNKSQRKIRTLLILSESDISERQLYGLIEL